MNHRIRQVRPKDLDAVCRVENACSHRRRLPQEKRLRPACKEEKIGMYESFGFSCRGRSDSSHGGVIWFDMVMEF